MPLKSGPNRNRFRLSLPWMRPRADSLQQIASDMFDNNREHDRAYPESLINLDVGAKVGYVGADYSVTSGVVAMNGFNTAYEDDYDFWKPASVGRLIVPKGLGGRYLIRANGRLGNNSASGTCIHIRYYPMNHATNFLTIFANYPGTGMLHGPFANIEGCVPYFLNDGDAIGGGVFHDTGANRLFIGVAEALNDVDPSTPVLECWRIGVRG